MSWQAPRIGGYSPDPTTKPLGPPPATPSAAAPPRPHVHVYRARVPIGTTDWIVETDATVSARMHRPRRFPTWAEAMRYADRLAVAQ